MLRIALVGAGIMGANHARIIASHPGVTLSHVADPDEARARAAASTAGAAWVPDHSELPGIVDAAVVAVPTGLHCEVASAFLDAGVPILVEKPLAATAAQAETLVKLAEHRRVALAVGHVERFNPAVLELESIVTDPIHLEFRRLSPYTARVGEGVVRDLMIHDIDLALWLARAEIVHLSAIASRHRSATDDLASATFGFANGVTATLTASRVGQEKIRHVDITQRTNYVHVDLVRQDVTIHRTTHSEFLTSEGARYAQAGVVEIPYLRHRGEPLALEFADFIRSVTDGTPPRVTGADGLRALAVAEEVERVAVRGPRD